MSGDLLRQAASALRETAGAGAGTETLARVLRDVRRGERRRRLTGLAMLPFALVLTTMGAWAATTGRLAAVARKVWPSSSESGSLAVPGPRATVPRAPEIVPLPPVVGPPPRPAALPAAGATRPPRASSPLRHAAEPQPREADDGLSPSTAADELYRRAHDAHFSRGDFGTALALWDRYLAVSPLPPLALEARYNRAIALLRLGRRDEAARALRPFADGDYGSYRAAEARALLRATPGSRNE